MSLSEGRCFCQKGEQRLNGEGECADCFVEGCEVCGSAYECEECQEGLVETNGQCACAAGGNRPNPEGVCEVCNVEGCSSCAVGDPDTCVKCFDCSASLIGGVCTCNYEGAAWDQQGFCASGEQEAVETQQKQKVASSPTETRCPKECMEGECSQNHCRQCQQGYFLRNNQCLKCDVTCSSCSEEGKCLSCKSGFSLNGGSVCDQCKELHCQECEEVEKCSQCREGFELEGGRCIQKKSISSNREWPSFEEWKTKFGKKYKSAEEERQRKAVYEHNLERLTIYEDQPYQVGVNSRSDLTDAEVTRSTGYRASPSRPAVGSQVQWKVGSQAPASLDWRDRGVITSIKDQGSCGSCWAFGCAATAETVVILNGLEDNSIDLAEQYLLECIYASDCDGTYYVEYVMNEVLEGIPRESQ